MEQVFEVVNLNKIVWIYLWPNQTNISPVFAIDRKMLPL